MYQTPQCIFPDKRRQEFYDPRGLTPGTRVCVRTYNHYRTFIDDDEDNTGYMFLGFFNRDPFPLRNVGYHYPQPPLINSPANTTPEGTIDGIIEQPAEWWLYRTEYSGYVVRINGQRYRYSWKDIGVYTTDEVMGDLISRENGFPAEIQNMIGRFTHGKSRYPNSRIDFPRERFENSANMTTVLLVLGTIMAAPILWRVIKKK